MRHVCFLIMAIGYEYASPHVSAQGSFELRNLDHLFGVNAPFYDWNGNLLQGSDWRVELYGGATANSLTPAVDFELGSPEASSLSEPGYVISPEVYIISGVPSYGWAWLQVKVWDVQLGATYEQALARGQGGYGQSTLFYAQGSYPGPLDPAPPAPLIGLQSFSVSQPVPESSTWALLAVGLGGLVWCRRR